MDNTDTALQIRISASCLLKSSDPDDLYMYVSRM